MFGFKLFFEESGVRTFSDPHVLNDTTIEFPGGYDLEPQQFATYHIPPEFHGMVIRDVILNHKKGPHGHGEPHMRYEEEKKKWRDFYGSYSKLEMHDMNSDKWVAYNHGGRDYKHAEYRPSWEPETLHDWISEVGRISPDMMKISNPGNQRAKTNPITGEKVDPNDKRSTVTIGPITISFFGKQAFEKKEYIQWTYSPGGTHGSTRFSDLDKGDQPTYGTFGIGYYPGALALWTNRNPIQRAKPYHNPAVHRHMQMKHSGIEQGQLFVPGDSGYFVDRNEKSVLYSLKYDPNNGQGTHNVRMKREGNNSFRIMLPPNTFGKTLASIELMVGKNIARPSQAPPGSQYDDGTEMAKVGKINSSIHANVEGNTVKFRGREHSIGPVITTADYPGVKIAPGDSVRVSSSNTAFIMAWRLGIS